MSGCQLAAGLSPEAPPDPSQASTPPDAPAPSPDPRSPAPSSGADPTTDDLAKPARQLPAAQREAATPAPVPVLTLSPLSLQVRRAMCGHGRQGMKAALRWGSHLASHHAARACVCVCVCLSWTSCRGGRP